MSLQLIFSLFLWHLPFRAFLAHFFVAHLPGVFWQLPKAGDAHGVKSDAGQIGTPAGDIVAAMH